MVLLLVLLILSVNRADELEALLLLLLLSVDPEPSDLADEPDRPGDGGEGQHWSARHWGGSLSGLEAIAAVAGGGHLPLYRVRWHGFVEGVGRYWKGGRVPSRDGLVPRHIRHILAWVSLSEGQECAGCGTYLLFVLEGVMMVLCSMLKRGIVWMVEPMLASGGLDGRRIMLCAASHCCPWLGWVGSGSGGGQRDMRIWIVGREIWVSRRLLRWRRRKRRRKGRRSRVL